MQPPWNHAIDATVKCLQSNNTWLERKPSVKQTFCLDFVNACCTRIQIISAFDWVEIYPSIIEQFGAIYSKQYYDKMSVKQVLQDELPQRISESSSNSVKKYFSWIQKVHHVLSSWKTKLSENDANYDEIHLYTQRRQCIQSIARHVSATSLVMSAENLTVLKNTFVKKFDELNFLLLKYVPEDPNFGW